MSIFKSLFMLWLYILLFDSSESLVEEVRRKLCPPMEKISQPINRVDTSERITKLREEMHSLRSINGPPLDAYIITRYDEHMNDFVSDNDKRLEYISGYTGNYGLVVITKNKQVFWTDELHYTQADNELSCNWTLFKTDVSTYILPAAIWLVNELQSNMRIGADPKLMSNSEWELIIRTISAASKSIVLSSITNNLVDVIWPENERSSLPNLPAYVWPEEYSGRSWKDKLNSLREHLKSLDVEAIVITSLSEIGWLLNIRGFDVPFNPFVKAYCVVTRDQLHLFINTEKLTPEVHKHLYTESCVSAYCTRLNNYTSLWTEVRKMSVPWKKILLPSMSHYSPGVSRHIYTSISQEKRRTLPSPVIKMMAEKNEAEKRGMREAHIRDAVIFCNFSVFLIYEMQRSAERWSEAYLANLTNEFRSKDLLIRGSSYPTMVASGPNTGMPLYVPTNETSITVKLDELLVIDSGSHYWDGTTALARTFRLDATSVTNRDIEVYTSVLIGLIDFASLSFPPYLTTSQIDIIARTKIWQLGRDYPHGTGHGIGVFSNLYESPIDINYKNGLNDTLKVGNFILAETGFYKEEDFGMKLSCVLEVVYKNDSSGYLSFEPVTLFPFEHRMINYTSLSVQQKTWLNDYNSKIRATVGSELQRQALNNGFNWLVDRTEPIQLNKEEEEEENDDGTVFYNKSNLKYFLVTALFVTLISNIMHA